MEPSGLHLMFGFQYVEGPFDERDCRYVCVRDGCPALLVMRSNRDFNLLKNHNHPRLEQQDPKSARSYVLVETPDQTLVNVVPRTQLIVRSGICEVGGRYSMFRRNARGCPVLIDVLVKEICEDKNNALSLMEKRMNELGLESSSAVNNNIGKRRKQRGRKYNTDTYGRVAYPLHVPEKLDCPTPESSSGRFLSQRALDKLFEDCKAFRDESQCCESPDCAMSRALETCRQTQDDLLKLRSAKRKLWATMARFSRSIDYYNMNVKPMASDLLPRFNYISREDADHLAAVYRRPLDFARVAWSGMFASYADQVREVSQRDPAKVLEVRCLMDTYFPSLTTRAGVLRWKRVLRILTKQAIALRNKLLLDAERARNEREAVDGKAEEKGSQYGVDERDNEAEEDDEEAYDDVQFEEAEAGSNDAQQDCCLHLKTEPDESDVSGSVRHIMNNMKHFVRNLYYDGSGSSESHR